MASKEGLLCVCDLNCHSVMRKCVKTTYSSLYIALVNLRTIISFVQSPVSAFPCISRSLASLGAKLATRSALNRKGCGHAAKRSVSTQPAGQRADIRLLCGHQRHLACVQIIILRFSGRDSYRTHDLSPLA